MKILITGGSGFIGSTAVDHFRAKGWEVANLDIAPPKVASQADAWIEADIRDGDALKTRVADFRPDYVLNLAAVTGAQFADLPPEHFDANTRGVENLIAASEAAGSVSRSLYVSSLLVCRNGYIPVHDEDYCAPGPYGASKVEGERIVRREGRRAGEWVIVRPTSVWGPWFELSYRTFFRMIDKGLYVKVGGTEDLIKPLTFVGNAVHMMDRLLTGPAERSAGKTFYLVDYPETEVGRWADMIQAELGAPRIRTAPRALLSLAAGAGDLLQKLGWSDPPLTTFRLNNMTTGGRYPFGPTLDAVGTLPFSMEDAVKITADWMRSQNLLTVRPTR